MGGEEKKKHPTNLLKANMSWIRLQIFGANVACLLLFLVCFWALPINTAGLKAPADRLVFTFRWLFVSSLSILFALFGVLKVRGTSNAVDPINGGSENLTEVPNRILRNTVEQYFLHMSGLIMLTTILEPSSLKAIPILVGLFLLGRITFWFGYTRSPFNRSFGFMATLVPTLVVYGYCVYRLITGKLLVP